MLVASGSCIANPKYPRNLFAVSALHYDSVREAHGLDWYLQSKEAKVILGASAGLMGIDPTYIQLAASAVPTATQVGEETHYVLPVPSGYSYCATRIRVTSVVPADGSQSATINTAINPTEFQMTTVTPVLGLGGGRSWAEGDVQVFGVLPQYLDEFEQAGVCKKITQQVGLWSCKGRTACSTGFVQGDPENAGPSKPDLTHGWP